MEDDTMLVDKGEQATNDLIPLRPGFTEIKLPSAEWRIPTYLKDLTSIGRGAFSHVCSAVDIRSKKGTKVAVKKLSRPFETQIVAKRVYREMCLLKHMNHENVRNMKIDNWTYRSFYAKYLLGPVYRSFMDCDLSVIVRTQKLSGEHVQFLVYQLVRALKYIHSAGVIHRDLKPSNIAVNEMCELKILDFGLARVADDEMTGYVVTRWYRAPEVMLNWMHYTQTVDIWSVGCIMAEIMTSKPLFPGTTNIDQLTRIFNLLGKPSQDLIDNMKSADARNYVTSMPHLEKKNFNTVFVGADPKGIDLLEKMLNLDGNRRITAADVLAHPYLAQYSDPDDEPTCSKYDASFEADDLDISAWKEKVYRELQNFGSTP